PPAARSAKIQRAAAWDLLRFLFVGLPVADIGDLILAAADAIGAERVQVVFAFAELGRIQIFVRASPRIFWQLVEIAAVLSVARRRVHGRHFRQRAEALLGARALGCIEAGP